MAPKALSAGVIVVRRQEGSWLYLLLRVYGYWDFPKGIVEHGEDPLQTARREVEEETGLMDLTFLGGHGYRETPPYGRGKIARYYIAETRKDQVVLPVSKELGRPEHHEFRWLSYQEARALLVPRVASILDWAHALISTEMKADSPQE